MANVMSMKKVFNKTSRNGFDLSEKNIFSAKIGELLPCACIECIPGDSFKINTKNFTRTMPVNTAAYTRIREYYDWFFVPTNLMWNKFNTFVTRMGNNNQNADTILSTSPLGDEHPYMYSNQIKTLLEYWNTQTEQNMFGYNRAFQSAKLLEYLDYGNWTNSDGTITEPITTAGLKLNPFPLLAYQKIYSDYYRNSQWEEAFAPAFNINYLQGYSNNSSTTQIPIGLLVANNPAQTMFDLQYVNWNKDMFLGVLPNSQYGDSASVQLDVSGTFDVEHGQTSSFEQFLYIKPLVSGSQGQSLHVGESNSNINANHVVANGNVVKHVIPDEHIQALRINLGLENSQVSTDNLSQTFSILALRHAEALQKWKEITQTHQQDYASQLEAHFGVKVSDAYSERCKYLGGNVSTIDISEVVNTNLASDTSQANIAGKGVGTGNGFIDFDTKVHGYLMCVYHATPILDYGTNGIKKRNLKTKVTDYAIPEFDNTGMVQVPWIELISPSETSSSVSGTDSADMMGYAPRYYDYKTSYDKVRGAFTKGGLDSWVAPFDSAYIDNYLTAMVQQGLQPELTFQFFKVNPATMNPIFVGQVDEEHYDYKTDQLLINCAFDIKAVRNLDVNGLPY